MRVDAFCLLDSFQDRNVRDTNDDDTVVVLFSLFIRQFCFLKEHIGVVELHSIDATKRSGMLLKLGILQASYGMSCTVMEW